MPHAIVVFTLVVNLLVLLLWVLNFFAKATSDMGIVSAYKLHVALLLGFDFVHYVWRIDSYNLWATVQAPEHAFALDVFVKVAVVIVMLPFFLKSPHFWINQ